MASTTDKGVNMMALEIEIPEANDPEWQTEQLRVIASKLDEIKEMGVSDKAYDQILVIEAHIEALREYSGY